MNLRIFPIIAFTPSEKDYTDNWLNGTAFLIDDFGHFYTAGHNFFKRIRGSEPEKLKCFALINGELFPTEEIITEYDLNSEEIMKDFVYGRILNFNSLPNNKTIDCDNSIAIGYSQRDLKFEKIETVFFGKNKFYLYKVPILIGTNSLTISKDISISHKNVLFFTTESEIPLNGLSGGPICQNNEILGVLVSKCFITKEYIDMLLKDNP